MYIKVTQVTYGQDGGLVEYIVTISHFYYITNDYLSQYPLVILITDNVFAKQHYI